LKEVIKTLRPKVSHLSSQPVKDEEQLEYKKDEFIEVISSASCKVSDIQGILYGPQSSRFWLYRKHIMTMEMKRFKNSSMLPFMAWECLTLQLKNRSVDLVIRN
jgi:hypothetical protein